MSALSLILTAAMAVPGDEPEKVSGEMVQLLDMSGEWEGIQSTASQPKATIRIVRGNIKIEVKEKGSIEVPWKVIDEGEGKLRMRIMFKGGERIALGIYKWQGKDLYVSCRREDEGPPTSFLVEEGNCLFILHRVKSRK